MQSLFLVFGSVATDVKHKHSRKRMQERQAGPVPLSVAASLIHFELQCAATSNVAALDRALDDAALALAQISDIYYENELGHVMRIPDDDLRSGLFHDGAKVFRTSGGTVFNNLSMRRIDVMYAIEVLGKAHRALGAAVGEKEPKEPAAE